MATPPISRTATPTQAPDRQFGGNARGAAIASRKLVDRRQLAMDADRDLPLHVAKA